jgi:quercetin dioxygenase-like cupin family protein
MRQTHVITSPNRFVVEEYSPGYTIDFRQPPDITDMEELRRSFDAGRYFEAATEAELASRAGRALVDLGIVEDEDDFSASLHAYTGETDLGAQLAAGLLRLGVRSPPDDLAARLVLLLRTANCLSRSAHHDLRLHCHAPGSVTALEADATHYGYVLEGDCTVGERGRKVAVNPNGFFCIAGAATVEGTGKCVVTTRFNYRGMTLFGGELEDWGRLRYIDGCTDTLLVAPVKRGDPCLNALYFPASTRQTRHVHPSVRCGVVVGGEGVCKTPSGDHPLRKGSIFFLPPETYHAFHTDDRPVAGRSALTVLAFHPDSDFGPTDEDHPMINRTYFKFLHRLSSLAEARSA